MTWNEPVGPSLSGGGGVELSQELRREWLRLVAALRTAMHASVDLDAPPARLRELAEQAATLAEELTAHAGGKPVPIFQTQQDPGRPGALNAYLPFSPVMGHYNPLAPPVEFALDGDHVVGRVRLREAFQGGPGVAHGGALSLLFDEVLALATIVKGVPGYTVSLKVEYRKPTPVLEELRFESRVDRVTKRRVHASASCRAGDQIVAEAKGVFARPAPSSGWVRRVPQTPDSEPG
jgi:acyl-coenzyme A thioesterase PaaI-like protein